MSHWNTFQKKHKKHKGRTKGTPNKATKAVKDALENTYHGLGGDAALKAFAKDNPDAFYRLWIKMLPQHMRVDAAIAMATATMTSAEAEKLIKKLHGEKKKIKVAHNS